ncbi:hypothetical protein MiSe_30580 [Microseira wollei NIES-4236]|uniref:Uncharacterized protein n=1 Tax=Microseira wollei NIES-4236 TaxID=2530354 RepID=A0AAV3XD81_9CYAN|nr:hypothetical protein MiSe_30580 [Microseira wollei NIES-4236]
MQRIITIINLDKIKLLETGFLPRSPILPRNPVSLRETEFLPSSGIWRRNPVSLRNSSKKKRVGHKPGSVLFGCGAAKKGGYLSGTPVTRRLLRFLGASPYNGTGKRPTIVPPTLLPTGVYRASASRRCWCALTAPLHPYREWVIDNW